MFLQRLLRRTLKTMVNELKRGDHITHNDKLLVIDTVHSVQKGRGCRSYVIAAKEFTVWGPNAPLPAMTTIKPSSKDWFDVVAIKDLNGTYLYKQGGQMAVMGPDMDEHFIPTNLFTDSLLLLMESGEKIRIRRVEGEEGDQERIVAANTGTSIRCTVRQVNQQGSTTVAVTVSGGRVTCPSIVDPGDQINVDATTGQYLGRVIPP